MDDGYEYGSDRMDRVLGEDPYSGEVTTLIVSKIREMIDHKPEKAAGIVRSLMQSAAIRTPET